MSDSRSFVFVVYVLYTGAFFIMAGALFVAWRRTARIGIARNLMILALFALVHGLADVLDAYIRLHDLSADAFGPVVALRMSMLGVSFVILLVFGVLMLVKDRTGKRAVFALGGLAVVGVLTAIASAYSGGMSENELGATEQAIRYFVGLPGALLAAGSLGRLAYRSFKVGLGGFGRGAIVAAVGLAAYAVFAGALSTGYPATIYLAGLPIQLYRMLAAIVMASGSVGMLLSLRVDVVTEDS